MDTLQSHPAEALPTSTRPRAVAAVLVTTTVAVLPSFLTGALAVQIRADLHLTATSLGLLVGCFFAASAAGSVHLGRVADRLGWQRAMGGAAALSALVLAAIAALADGWLVLAVLLGVAGLAQALANPAANLALARNVRQGRQGLMFGAKQAAVPLATLLGGIAVPTLALTVGWRWAFAAASIGAVSLLLVVPRRSAAERAAPRPHQAISTPLRSLVLLSVGGGLGAGVAVALGAFAVVSSVEAGMTDAQAALLLIGGSLSAICVRLLHGWLADRHLRRPLRAVSTALLIGAAGYVLLATGVQLLLVVGMVLAFGMGWGWNGLFHYAVVQANTEAPAAASGITQTGFAVGSALTPPVFGLVAEHLSFGAAWIGAAVLAVVAAALVEAGRRSMSAHLGADSYPG